MSENEGFDIDEFQRELWSERVQAPQSVFDALLADHQAGMLSMIEPLMDTSTECMEASLSGMLATGECDWYVKPAKKTSRVVERLSKGFAIASTDIAGFFDDIYVGKDIKDVLLNPDTPPSSYPNTIAASGKYFLKTISQYLPEDFWEGNKPLQDVKLSLEFVGAFAANEQNMQGTTAMLSLAEAQTMSRTMPLVAETLRSKGHKNLATIADSFASKGNAISSDIITKVSHAVKAEAQINLSDPSNTLGSG